MPTVYDDVYEEKPGGWRQERDNMCRAEMRHKIRSHRNRVKYGQGMAGRWDGIGGTA